MQKLGVKKLNTSMSIYKDSFVNRLKTIKSMKKITNYLLTLALKL